MEHVLKLEVNGKYLTFFPNAKITLLRKSPLFLNEADPGSRIFTFTIPAEPNAEILDFANLLFNNKKIATVDCNVYLKGNFYKRAKLDITGFTKETYDIRVRFDKPYFVEAAERKLRSFEYNSPTPYRYDVTSFLQYIYSCSYVAGSPSVNFTIQIDYLAPLKDNDSFSSVFNYNTGTPETLAQLLDRIALYFNTRLLIDGIGAEVITGNQIRFYSPYNYDGEVSITWVLDATALSQFANPTLVNGTTTALRKFQEQIKLANATIDNPDDFDFIYFPVYNPVGTSETNYNKIINDYWPAFSYGAGTQPSFQGDSIDGREYNVFSPFANIYKAFKYIADELKITLDDQFFDEELKTLYYYNNIGISLNVNRAAFGNRAQLVFKFSDLLPDITFKDFVYDLTNMFCVVFDFESNDDKIRIIPRKKILQSDKINNLTPYLIFDYLAENEPKVYALLYTWSEEPLSETRILKTIQFNRKPDVTNKAALPLISVSRKGDLAKAFKENYYYLVKNAASSTFDWFFYDESLEDYVPANFTDEIKTGLSTLFTQKLSNSFVVNEAPSYDDGGVLYNNTKVTWLLPYTETSLNLNDTNEFNFSQRLLFYRGLKECDINFKDSFGADLAPAIGQYPFGTYHNYDYKGNKCGDYSLAWNAPDGLTEIWWKLWIELLDNAIPITLEFNLSASQFASIDLLEKQYADNQVFFIDEMEVELSNEMSPVKVKGYIYKTV